MRKRRLVYYVACTVDGFIAARDGSFDCFLQEGDHLRDLIADFPESVPAHLRRPLGVSAPNRCFDAVLMGRRTWEVGRDIGVTSPYPHLEQYLFSRTLAASPDPALALVSGEPAAFVRELKQRRGKDIWLCGGADLAATLVDEIDDLILKSNPVVLGAGIPLFARATTPRPLRLLHYKHYDNGFVRLHYRVQR
jgi:dihydrofolate reductase